MSLMNKLYFILLYLSSIDHLYDFLFCAKTTRYKTYFMSIRSCYTSCVAKQDTNIVCCFFCLRNASIICMFFIW